MFSLITFAEVFIAYVLFILIISIFFAHSHDQPVRYKGFYRDILLVAFVASVVTSGFAVLLKVLF